MIEALVVAPLPGLAARAVWSRALPRGVAPIVLLSVAAWLLFALFADVVGLDGGRPFTPDALLGAVVCAIVLLVPLRFLLRRMRMRRRRRFATRAR